MVLNEKFNPHIEVEPDGLIIPEVHDWSLKKYRLLGTYCDIFTNGMKNKWEQLVYVDLFAGAGYSKIIESNQVYLSSSLIAMSLPVPFTKYILCEKDPQNFEALEKRVKRDFNHLNCSLIFGDCNQLIDKICSEIPVYRKDNRVLTFCFVDPFDLEVKFNTIRSLNERFVDFLILHALYMDANRNLMNYIKPGNSKIAEYLGLDDWREMFEKDSVNYEKFVKFLADQYQSQMVTLGYQKDPLMNLFTRNENNSPLYYLFFYSKNHRGVDFFKKVQKGLTAQISLGL